MPRNQSAGLLKALKGMPRTDKRQLFDERHPNGYLESTRDWADRNARAVQWFSTNAPAIRKAIADAKSATNEK